MMEIARGKDLSGRTAVVTGAASGMGAAAAARLIAEGVSVLGVDRVGEGLVGTHTLTADLADPDAFAAIAGAAQSLLGGCDILINNAGVCPNGPFSEMTEADWDSALGINVTAVMKLTRALLPMLAASRAGRVVNVGSIMSRYGDAGLVAYTTSKHAILGLTRALAMELGPQGITVNCVQPGAIATGMTRGLFEDTPGAKDYYAGRSALGRVGQPEDVSDVMVFLATDDARFITGQGIMVDGGVMVHS
jgi:NAD(P)-dependent dehydrogenase (short-subunit alcohol dehydrogenase family)